LKRAKKDKRLGIAEHVTLGTWNVRGLSHKLDELQLESKKIGIPIITETKKKLQRT
jgi:hypothetical protein